MPLKEKASAIPLTAFSLARMFLRKAASHFCPEIALNYRCMLNFDKR